ncbi:MAG: putative phage tail protein [Acetobacteraceae bacterium]
MDATAYLSQLIGLLPPGDALAREPGSVLERLLSVPAAELARVDGRVEALLLESDPARTAEMLADWERALGLPDICYPNFQFSRASRGWYFDGAGVLREAAVDEPRYLFDALGNRTDAVLVEPEATNFVLQPYYQVGASGQWIQAQGTAIPSLTQNFAQSLEGLNRAARVRWVGPNNGDQLLLRFYTIGVPANTPSTISFWVFARALGNASHISVDPGDFGSPTGNLLDQFRVGAWSRVVGQVTPIPAAGAWMDLNFANFTTGEIDIDIWGVQVEAGTAPTSLILPAAPSTVGPTTRAADQLYIATTQERRARILARLIERFEPTPAAIIGLAARLGDSVTLTEFRPHSCEDSCEAAVADEPWAHAFQIAGGAQQVVEFTCEDTCETPLSQWRTGRYECAIRRFAPAHTVPIFTYA